MPSPVSIGCDPAYRDGSFARVPPTQAPPSGRRAVAPSNGMDFQRLVARGRSLILDRMPEAVYEDLVELASRICATPIALVTLVDRDRQWSDAELQQEVSDTDWDMAFCVHAVLMPDEVFTVHDAQLDPRFHGHPSVTGAPHLRFYAGAPIVTDDGFTLGTVCVIDDRPRVLDEAQERCLRAVARQAAYVLSRRGDRCSDPRRAKTRRSVTDEARLEADWGIELLKLTLRGGELGMWELHVPSGVWTTNARERAMLGIAADQSLLEPFDWREAIHPGDWPTLRSALEEHLSDRSSPLECIHRLRHRDGRWLHVYARAVVVGTDLDGKPVRIIGTHRDVSQENALALQRSSDAERLALALSGGDVGLWDLYLVDRTVVFNETWAAMLGYQVDAVEGTVDFWNRLIHDDDAPSYLEAMRQHLRGESAMFEADVRLKHRDGYWVWITTRARVVERDDAGRAVRIVGMNFDISARKASEAALAHEVARRKVVLQQATDAMFLIDEDMVVSEANPAFATMLGYAPDEAALLRPWDWDVRFPTEARVRAGIGIITTTQGQLETVWRRKDGEHLEIEANYSVVVIDGRRHILYVCRDVTERRRDRRALRRATVTLERTADLARVGGWEIDLANDRLTWSDQVYRIHELERDDTPNLATAIAFYLPEAQAAVQRAIAAAVADDTPWDLELPMKTARGNAIWVRAMGGVSQRDGEGHATHLVGALQDITERKQAELRLAEGERRLRGIADSVPALIAEIDCNGCFCFVNEVYRDWFGVNPTEVLGKTVRNSADDSHSGGNEEEVERALRGERVVFERSVVLASGKRTLQSIYVPRLDEESRPAGFYALTSDITELKETQRKLDALARVDALTGLANRRRLEECLKEALADSHRNDSTGALLYLDLDRFKSINDEFGHAGGDEVLRQFAGRLRRSVRQSDTVARYAGDEFVILLEALPDRERAHAVAGKILASMDLPVSVRGRDLAISTSIGLTHFGPGESIESVLARADAALYEAKAAGRGRICGV